MEVQGPQPEPVQMVLKFNSDLTCLLVTAAFLYDKSESSIANKALNNSESLLRLRFAL